MNLQEALAMYPPDGPVIEIRSEDAYQEAQLKLEAGYTLAAGVRLLKEHQLQTVQACRRLISNAVSNRDGEYAMVPMSSVEELLEKIRALYGPGVRHEVLR